jgi:L-lactate dehydrogenase complex protein LldG
MANTAKENILKKVRAALAQPTPIPFPNSEGSSNIFAPITGDSELAVAFAQKFTSLQGNFAYCDSMEQLHTQLAQLIAAKQWQKVYAVDEPLASTYANTSNLAACHVSLTLAESLVARTGTIVLSSAQTSGRTVSVYAPIHVCVAFTSQVVYDVKDALQLIKEKYNGNIPSFITFASGPSRTADIEKTLVTGVHGPKEVYLFLVEDTAAL